MLINSDELLNKLPCPVFVARPIYTEDSENIIDFEICYMNQQMVDMAGYIIQDSKKWSEFRNRTTDSISWQQLLYAVSHNLETSEVNYFSPIKKAWYKLQLTLLEKDYILVTFLDITSQKNYAKQLKDSACKDPLTGLLSRSVFNDALDIAIDESFNEKKRAAVLVLDIDHLKNINDSLGTKEGDKKIIEVSNVLKTFERETIKTFRYGDDEFIVLISKQDSFDSITNICDTIFESFQFNQISISGGISVFPDNTEQKEELIRFADMAIHVAKKNGRNNFTYFESEMQRVFIQHLTLQSKMTSAIIDCNFKQYYQPQFDITTGELRGFEALIRWYDEDLGEITPTVFIPLAEESGLIVPIGRWVLTTAIATLKKWQDKFNFKGIMSVNISPIQLRQDTFIAELSGLINKFQIDPSYLELEITEGVMIHNIDITIDKLLMIKDMGIRVSLDDFGTGYSSLSYLQALPLNTLKIDKSFINNICSEDGIQANITSSIINMVQNMGLETIAEGVENDAQLDLLSKFNCNIVQGFLRGKPMPYEACDSYLNGDETSLIRN